MKRVNIRQIDRSQDWFYLCSTADADPNVVNVTLPEPGKVITYTLNGVTMHRFIPDAYTKVKDTFYSNFTGGVLSNVICTRQ